MRADLIRLTVLVAMVIALAVATITLSGANDAPSDTPRGAALFISKGCSGCHTLAGVAETAQVGPNLTDLASVARSRVPGLSAEEYVRQSIREPQAFRVPGFGAGFASMPVLPVTDAELTSLVEFLMRDR